MKVPEQFFSGQILLNVITKRPRLTIALNRVCVCANRLPFANDHETNDCKQVLLDELLPLVS